MKALILAGGRGRRLNALTKEKNKSMIRLFGKPLIEYNLEHAIEIGIKEVIIVVGYRKEEIMSYFGKEFRGVKIKYIFQKEQRGLVSAIEYAKDAIGDSDFVLMLADEVVVDIRLKEMLKKFREEKLFAICGITFDDDKSSIGKTYSAMVNEKGRVFRLIEKPRFPINKIKGTGHCIFKNEILEYIERTPINANRGERELVDMIQCVVDEGKNVNVFPITDGYVNVNTPEDFETAEKLTKKSNPSVLIVHPQMKFFGGAELLIVELANWLTKRGIKNDILTASKSKEIEEELINTKIITPKNNINISATGFNSAKDILGFIKIFRKELRSIGKEYDVINFHNFPATWTLFPRRKPCAWMLNEPPDLWSRPDASFTLKALNRIRRYLDKKIVQKIDVICVADEFNRERCLKRYKKNPRIIYYGVNYDFFSEGDAARAIKKFKLENRFVVIQSGVLTENKNQIKSVKAIEGLKEKIPNILLVLAGKADEKYEKMLQEYIKKRKLEKYVLFTGNINREELRDLYKASQTGIFPVGKQGGWLAPFEMICSKKPVIVSDEMGAALVIRKNNLGISTKDYCQAMLEVYENYEKYEKMAKRAALFVRKNLSWERFADRMIRAYKDAIKMHQ